MIKSLRKFGYSVVLLVLVMSTSGCFALLLGAAAGAGGVVWAKGALQQSFEKPASRVHIAAIRALESMKLPIITDRSDDLTAKIESKFADGTNIWIDIDQLTSTSSKISIRVGALGDEFRSREILDAIKKRL